MIENATPIRARRSAPAARALALITAAAVAAAGAGPARRRRARRNGAAAACRSSATPRSRTCCATTRAPILKAAGLAQQNVKVVVLNDRAFNAFVMDGRHIFINAGALFDAKTPNEIIGVFAHETGHLAGGHLMRLREKLAQAQTAVDHRACCSASAPWWPARAPAPAGHIGAGRDHGAAVGDPALAARLCAHPGRPGRPCRREIPHRHPPVGQGHAGSVQAPEQRQCCSARSCADPYLQTHPLPPDRVAALEALAKASPYWNVKDPPELQLRHDLMRAKLSGFLEAAGHRGCAAIRSATTACRRAMPAPSPPTAMATCARRSRRSTG